MKKRCSLLAFTLLFSLFSSSCTMPTLHHTSSDQSSTPSTPQSSISESVAAPSSQMAQSIAVSSPGAVRFQIYTIQGTAAAETGKSWANMLAWRKQAAALAEKYPDFLFTNMNPSEKVVYLTFDDGPDSQNTVSVMNTLLKYHVGGTFFFTGVNIKAHPSVVNEVHENGFAIGLHGYDHTSLALKTATATEEQINNTNQALFDATGYRTSIMRPPYGDVNDATIETIHDMHYRIYLWSIDTLDWDQKDKNEVLRNVKEYLRPGDIILMHAAVGKPLSAEILPEIIEYIQSQHYEIKNLPQE